MRSTISTSYWPSSAIAKPSSPSVGMIGDVADLAERLDQIVGGVAVVFDDQKAHGHVAVPAEADRPRRPVTAINIVLHRSRSNALPSERNIARNVRGVARLTRHPLDQLHPGGGDGCRERSWYRRGRALRPAPRVRPPAGATDAGGSPHSCQALPSGSATKRVPASDFTRNNSVCLPSLRASAIACARPPGSRPSCRRRRG